MSTKRALAVECRLCAARVGEHCTADSGKSTRPHAVRVARSNGLKPCPRRAGGGYQRPRDGIEYTPQEIDALAELDAAREVSR